MNIWLNYRETTFETLLFCWSLHCLNSFRTLFHVWVRCSFWRLMEIRCWNKLKIISTNSLNFVLRWKFSTMSVWRQRFKFISSKLISFFFSKISVKTNQSKILPNESSEIHLDDILNGREIFLFQLKKWKISIEKWMKSMKSWRNRSLPLNLSENFSKIFFYRILVQFSFQIQRDSCEHRTSSSVEKWKRSIRKWRSKSVESKIVKTKNEIKKKTENEKFLFV